MLDGSEIEVRAYSTGRSTSYRYFSALGSKIFTSVVHIYIYIYTACGL